MKIEESNSMKEIWALKEAFYNTYKDSSLKEILEKLSNPNAIKNTSTE